MAVAIITPIRSQGSNLEATEIVWTTLGADGGEFPMSGNDVLLIENVDDADPVTVTIVTSQDGLGRTGNVSEAIPALGVRVVGPFTDVQGWRQPGGSMQITVSVADLARVAVIRQPA